MTQISEIFDRALGLLLHMNVAIIAAGGQGTRMAVERPKQFLELAGIPIIIRTLRVFEDCNAIQEIIVVIPSEHSAEFLSLAQKQNLTKLARVVPGGATRAESVLQGFRAVREATAQIIAVHDAVRPFVTAHEIERTVAAAEKEGAAILVSRPVDTIKEVADGVVVKTLKRGDLRNALTPQCFTYRLLRRAYEGVDVLDPELTDESCIVERLGVSIVTVEGSSRNIKITGPEDILLAEALISS